MPPHRWARRYRCGWREIFPIIDASEAAETLRGLPSEVRDEAVDLLVRAAAADKKIAPEERVYLDTVAETVGMPREDLERRIDDALAD